VDTTLLYPSKYISSDDLKGKHVTVTIRTLKRELLKRKNGEQEVLPILYFEETKKGLVTNKTNLKSCQSLLGSTNSDNWVGRQIVLYATPVQFGDEIRQGIRIAPRNAKTGNNGAKNVAVKASAVDPNDDVPGFDIPDGDANEDIPDDKDIFA
jgi:hypothetical protein